MEEQLKITLVNSDGESTISGTVQPLPAPLIFPPIYFLRFTKYKTEGKLWDKEEFEVKSGSFEYKKEEYDIPSSKGSWTKVDDDDDENYIDVRIHTQEPPNKFFRPY
ncbi:hypothetical protein ACTFIY_009996 [Dictyostelium cf. discoideum]